MKVNVVSCCKVMPRRFLFVLSGCPFEHVRKKKTQEKGNTGCKPVHGYVEGSDIFEPTKLY